MSLLTLKNRRERGFFDGQFLIAMPGMEDRNFARTVIYICAHSDAGAMGFVITRPYPAVARAGSRSTQPTRNSSCL
jgi:putative transcriptional regulator